MRPSSLDYSRPIYDPNYADNITGYEQSSQFYQPIYQSQYQNYNTGNRMGVSQYGQQQQFGGGFGGFGGGFGGGFMPQMQTPFQQPMQSMQRPTGTPQFGVMGPGSFGQPQQQQQMPQQQSRASFNDLSAMGMAPPGMQRSTGAPQFGELGIGRFMQDYMQQAPQPQPFTPQRTSSGPSQPIVTRSSGMRGTPNVMRRAQGGITSLLDDVA
jgi:hypothetical protein